MATVREVLHQYTKKISLRAIAKSFGMSKTTVRKYLHLSMCHVGFTEPALNQILIF
jgi:response regulator of citrate/malate metabolism